MYHLPLFEDIDTMALLVLVNLYFKFFLAVPCLTLKKYTSAYCIRGVLYFLFVTAMWASHLYFFNF